MFFLDGRAARVTWTVLVMVAGLALLYLLRRALLLLAFSLFFAYLIGPLVRLAQERLGLRRRRASAVALVYLALVLALGGIGAGVGPRLSRELANLADKLPEMSRQIGSGTFVGTVLERRGWADEPIREVQRLLATHTSDIIQYAQQAAASVLKWVTGAWVIVLVPIFAFFILKDAQEAAAGIEHLIEDRQRRQLWRDIAEDIHLLLAGYVRSLLLLSLVTFVVWSVVFLAVGLPYAMVMAAVGGTLEFIPVVGPLAAGVIVVGASFFSGYGHPWLLVLFVLLWRGIQDYGTSPLVMARGVEVHPALVIFGVIAGGEIGGPAGMFLSVPVIAAVRIVWRRVRAFHGRRPA
jgi:predicted PurR-regulated permease PerM